MVSCSGSREREYVQHKCAKGRYLEARYLSFLRHLSDIAHLARSHKCGAGVIATQDRAAGRGGTARHVGVLCISAGQGPPPALCFTMGGRSRRVWVRGAADRRVVRWWLKPSDSAPAGRCSRAMSHRPRSNGLEASGRGGKG